MNYKICDLAKKHSSNGYILHIIFRVNICMIYYGQFFYLYFLIFTLISFISYTLNLEPNQLNHGRVGFLFYVRSFGAHYKLGRQLLNTRQDNLVGRGGRVFCFSVESTRFRWDCSRPQASFISGIGLTKSLFVWNCNIF
jgi:hypothetical protein